MVASAPSNWSDLPLVTGRLRSCAQLSMRYCGVWTTTGYDTPLAGFNQKVGAVWPLLESGRVEGALAQGVTTLVVGQDGESWIGANAATARYLNQYFGPVNGRLEPARNFSVRDFGQAVGGRLAQNVAVLASQGTIRHNVARLDAGPLDRELTAAGNAVAGDAPFAVPRRASSAPKVRLGRA